MEVTILHSSILAETFLTCWGPYTLRALTHRIVQSWLPGLGEDWRLCLTRNGIGSRVEEGENFFT